MKVKIASLIVALLVPLAGQAGINVTWSIGYGLYDVGVVNLTSTDPNDGFLTAGNSSLFQLIWTATSDGIGIVDPLDVDYVSGDNLVLDSRVITAGSGGYDEWGFNSTVPAPYINPVFTAGFVFMRVFQTASPTVGEYYFDSALLALQNRGSDPIADTQLLYLETGSDSYPSQGVALNLEIVPEPSVLAFLGLGGLALAVRRRFVA